MFPASLLIYSSLKKTVDGFAERTDGGIIDGNGEGTAAQEPQVSGHISFAFLRHFFSVFSADVSSDNLSQDHSSSCHRNATSSVLSLHSIGLDVGIIVSGVGLAFGQEPQVSGHISFAFLRHFFSIFSADVSSDNLSQDHSSSCHRNATSSVLSLHSIASDVGLDVGIIVPGVGLDVGLDVGFDVGFKVGLDVGLDVGMIVPGVGLDVGLDVGFDVGIIVPDVGLDVGFDVGFKVGLDVGLDVGIIHSVVKSGSSFGEVFSSKQVKMSNID